jgi:pimeloyl-ACP methyl ester carboxylesterase
MRRIPSLATVLAVVTVLAVAVFALHPAVHAVAKASFVLSDAFGAPLPRLWAPPVEHSEQRMADVVVDRYTPGSEAPPLLLVPGAAEDGREDERVVSIASSLAAAGREVVVPELDLYRQEIVVDDLDRVVAVVEKLCPPGGGLVLFGFSYGGSLALVAAADERVAGCIDLVATFGAYADLVGALQAAVTGVSVVNGERHPWDSADEPLVRTVLEDAAAMLVPAEEREPLRRALEEEDPADLSGAGRLVYRMLTTDDPARVADLARRLPPPGDALVETFSPVSVSHRVEVDVLAAHALDDPAVPVAELLRLRTAFPEAELMTVNSFRHVDLTTEDGLGPLIRDLVTAWSFMYGVLRSQEHWPWES